MTTSLAAKPRAGPDNKTVDELFSEYSLDSNPSMGVAS